MERNSTFLIVGLIIIGVLFLPKLGLFAVGEAPDSTSIVFQTFKDGSACSTNLMYPSGGALYHHTVTLYKDGTDYFWDTSSQFCEPDDYYLEGALAGTCPPYADAKSRDGAFCQSIKGYCNSLGFNVVDPYPYNGVDEIKCNAYCRPNLGICVMRSDGEWESQICTNDGGQIIHELCEEECVEGKCVTGPGEPIGIHLPILTEDFVYGEDISIPIQITYYDEPYETLVYARIEKNGVLISSIDAYTNSEGKAVLNFKTVNTLGDNDLIVSTTIRGETKEISTVLYFVDMPPIYLIIPSTTGAYHYGDRLEFNIRLLLGGTGYPNNLVNGKIENQGIIVSETSGFTDSDGYALLIFGSVEAIGDALLTVSTNLEGREKIASSIMYFSGTSILFTPTTESYIQSNGAPITFLVEVTDTKYRDISPELITDLQAITSLTKGTILNEQIEYLGSGVYEIKTDVDGTGVFLGKIAFDYEGTYFESPAIQIDVVVVTLAIDTSKMKPIAFLGATETFEINFASSLGFPLDPDSVEIIVSLPSGFEEETLTLSDLTRISEGKYTFDYTFIMVEKHSFDIYIDKAGYTRGNAKATVSVTEEEEFGYGLGDIKWILYGAIGLVILILLFRGKKK